MSRDVVLTNKMKGIFFMRYINHIISPNLKTSKVDEFASGKKNAIV